MKKSLIAIFALLTVLSLALASCTSVLQRLDEILKTEPKTDDKEQSDDGSSDDSKDATKRQRKG